MGRSSKIQEAQEARERKLQRELEAKKQQERQDQIIRRTLIAVLAVILLITGVTIGVKSCNRKPKIGISDPYYTATTETTEYVRLTVTYTDSKNVFRQDEIVVRLYSDIAPITVENFQKLVGSGFYNGLTFHRVVENFMIQGGDPAGNGSGGSEPIKGEFSANGVPNSLSHKRGVISMARLGNDMNSASSQFFIVHQDNQRSLDGLYAGFGEVVSGMSTVDGIAGTAVSYSTSGELSKPVNPITILKAEFVQKIG